MKQLKLVFTVVALVVTTLNVTAQVKKAPIKKKPVVVKKTVAFKPPVIKKIPGVRIKITTDSGVIVIRLYDSTPLHRDNFTKLVTEHFYDSLLFHRVIKGFMIQGGDPLSKNATPDAMLGMGGGEMQRIPAEIKPTLYHKKGVLAAARDGNPEKASSACQFYLVQGKKYTDQELNMMETQMGGKFSAAKRLAYKTLGGVPFLDMNYTVFGEVETGMAVIDKIANVPTAPGDRPIGDVRMKMEVLK
jgi:cyclophilin family peptidyl-prolyl cis-trans isomerase